jgi:hypothetical protein
MAMKIIEFHLKILSKNSVIYTAQAFGKGMFSDSSL